MGLLYLSPKLEERVYPFEGRVPKNSKENKKALLSDQCKEIQGKYRIEKTRDLQENERYQRNISRKDGTIKDRHGMDLTEAEDIKKRWQEYTKNCMKKIVKTQIITMV